MRAARIEGEVQSKIDQVEAERTARLAELDGQEEAERASLAERLAAETSEVIATGQKLQASLEKIHGKPAAEAVVLPWQEIEAPLVPAGAAVTREHLSALNDAIQGRLSEIEDTINREQEAVRNLIAARRELVRREAEQAIDGHRQAVEAGKAAPAHGPEPSAGRTEGVARARPLERERIPRPDRALGQLLQGRDGRRSDPRPGGQDRSGSDGQGIARRDQHDAVQAAQAESRETAARRRVVPQERQPPGVDDPDAAAGAAARAAADGAVGRRPLRHVRPE